MFRLIALYFLFNFIKEEIKLDDQDDELDYYY